MKKHNYHDAFTCPLTERGYLLEGAFHRVARSYKITYHDLPMLHVASVLYLYGADFGGIYPGLRARCQKDLMMLLGIIELRQCISLFTINQLFIKIMRLK